MESLDYWRLCDEFSIVQASLLIVGQNPDDANYIEGWEFCNRPQGYEAAKAALANAVKAKRIEAYTIYNVGGSIEFEAGRNIYKHGSVDVDKTTIHIDEIKRWLLSRGFKTGFFFENDTQQPNYLNPKDANYSSKLAAAIDVWQALAENSNLIKATSPKQAIAKWLRLNAAKYNLTKDDGNPNEQGIEDIAKVVNWQIKGGAPKTPEIDNPTTY